MQEGYYRKTTQDYQSYQAREQVKKTKQAELPEGASIVIDDESFKKYNVKSVPSIVLSKQEKCPSLVSCPITYDKVTGNIGILGALREFTKSGDLASEAESILLSIRKTRGINE